MCSANCVRRTDVAGELQVSAAVFGREARRVTVTRATPTIVGTRSLHTTRTVLPGTAQTGANTTARCMSLAARPLSGLRCWWSHVGGRCD